MELLFRIFVALLGGCIGSFLNVCIYRLPKEKSIVTPRSFCPNCKTTIKWYDNIPVLSFILLGAKCRQCKTKISFRYPFVELIAAVVFFLLYVRFGWSLNFFKFAFFFSMLIVLSFIDIDYHAIPAYLCVLGVAVGLAFALWESIVMFNSMMVDLKDLPIVNAFKALVFGLGFTYMFKFFGDVFVQVYLSMRKKNDIEGETESLGLGDVDYLGMVGVFMGIMAVVLTFFIAPFVAMFYAWPDRSL